MKELLMILKKEFIHIFRDKVSLLLVLAIPIILVLLFGFTISTELRNAKISILDLSKDRQSAKLAEKIMASHYFQVISFPESEAAIDFDFKNKNVKMALIIPPHLETLLTKEKLANIQIINDVSDLNVASILNNYMQSVLYDFMAEYNEINSGDVPVEISVKMQYNPELNSIYMFVPGIITLIMIIVTALMSSITLSREGETGSMNMLLITPVKKISIVLGKIIPYMILSFISTLMILFISVLVFHIPIGNLFLLLILCIIFMFAAASFGLMISAVVKTQLEAMMVTMMGLFLPTVLLSGFLFPLDNMPYLFQVIADIFPAKWFIIAIKDVMIKGAGFTEIWRYMSILLFMAVVLITVSLIRIDKRR